MVGRQRVVSFRVGRNRVGARSDVGRHDVRFLQAQTVVTVQGSQQVGGVGRFVHVEEHVGVTEQRGHVQTIESHVLRIAETFTLTSLDVDLGVAGVGVRTNVVTSDRCRQGDLIQTDFSRRVIGVDLMNNQLVGRKIQWFHLLFLLGRVGVVQDHLPTEVNAIERQLNDENVLSQRVRFERDVVGTIINDLRLFQIVLFG